MGNGYWTQPDYQHLLAAVRAAPDDDLPRLVLADWLEERGEWERAEWIRVSIELFNLRLKGAPAVYHRGDPDAAERFAFLKERKADLHHKWPRAWTEADEHAGLNTHGDDRGFVTRVSGPLAVLIGGTPCPACRSGVTIGCRTCGGSNHVRGVLRGLVRREPVRVVEVVDADPISVRGMNPPWRWLRATRVPYGAELPDEIFDLIPTHPTGCMYSQQWGKFFDTPDAAGAALSAAILRWAMTPEEVTTSPRPPGE